MKSTAAEVARWMERHLVVAQGRHRGQPFKVLDWQLDVLKRMESYPEVGCSVPRGNGKSTFVGGVAAATVHPSGPLHEPHADTVVVAASVDQARIAWESCYSLLFHEGPPSRSEWRAQNSHVRRLLQHKATGSALRCVSSDPRRAMGLQPALLVLDEGSSWPPSTSDAMVSALRTARGKVEGSHLLAISTRPEHKDHWFERMLGTEAGVCYSGSPEADPLDEAEWWRANPSLPHFPDLLEAIRFEAHQAAQDPMQLASFRALRLNAGVSDTQVSFVVEPGDWAKAEGDVPHEGDCYWGLDLSGGAAMSSVSSFWPATGRLDGFAVFPARPSLQARGVEDNVSDLYLRMAAREELLTLGSRVPDLPAMLSEAVNRWGAPAGGASDGFKRREWMQAFEDAGFRPRTWSWRKGAEHWASDLRGFRGGILEGKVRPVQSLLMRSGLAEARVHVDGRGNGRLAVRTQSGRRMRARDDIVVSMVMAVSLGLRARSQPQRRRGRVLV